MCEITQTQLAIWRDRLLSDWSHVKAALIARLRAIHHHDYADRLDNCEQDQLLEIASRLLLPEVSKEITRLQQIDAALCQMDLGLYGLCSDCEATLSIEQLDQDPTTQRCPHCEARYRKTLQLKPPSSENIYKL